MFYAYVNVSEGGYMIHEIEETDVVDGDYVGHRFANVRSSYDKGDLSVDDLYTLADHTQWYSDAESKLPKHKQACDYLAIIEKGWRVDIS
tara:strand:+ start:1198 stop:1467 length:270 start_codon:yes stop_codon:yes gene_type:complete